MHFKDCYQTENGFVGVNAAQPHTHSPGVVQLRTASGFNPRISNQVEINAVNRVVLVNG